MADDRHRMTDREHLRRLIADVSKLLRVLKRYDDPTAPMSLEESNQIALGEHLAPLRKSVTAAIRHLGEN